MAELLLTRLALGPVAGVGVFVVLAGGRCTPTLPRPLGRALLVRWLTLAVLAGMEEVVWRGVVLGGLEPVVGPVPAIGISSLGFAAWHWPSLGPRSAVHVVTGGAFGSAFLVGGIAAATIAHALYNLLVDCAVHAERVRLHDP
jgi:membrane protease YdiL (CAAX protease family)